MEHAKAYAKRFVILSIIMGVLGGLIILAAAPVTASALALSGTAKQYLRFMFFVMSYFVRRTGVQYDDGCGNFPIRRRYPVRPDPGCEHHVVLFHPAGISGGLCFPVECAGGVCHPDE
mgnify:CR=1 FL=1